MSSSSSPPSTPCCAPAPACPSLPSPSRPGRRRIPTRADVVRSRVQTPVSHMGEHMGLFDAFGYKGKRVLVVGGATGMGAAVAELVQDAGAEVVVMDRAEITLPGVKAIA